MTLLRARKQMDVHQVSYRPSINEDLGATIVMGTQQAGTRDDRTVDGVFAMWYGKGPGVDRDGDALHHGNAAGASKKGGVPLIVGDRQHGPPSSIPHDRETSLLAHRIHIVQDRKTPE